MCQVFVVSILIPKGIKKDKHLPRDSRFFKTLGNDAMIITDLFVGCKSRLKEDNGLDANHP